jgi:hypothetical protein
LSRSALDFSLFKMNNDSHLCTESPGYLNALISLDHQYKEYAKAVEQFEEKISWKEIARKHVELYDKIATEIMPRVIS